MAVVVVLEVAVREGQPYVRMKVFMQVALALVIPLDGFWWGGGEVVGGVVDLVGQVVP